MNSLKITAVVTLVTTSLMGLYTMPKEAMAEEATSVVMESQEVTELGPIKPVRIFSPIKPKPIVTETEDKIIFTGGLEIDGSDGDGDDCVPEGGDTVDGIVIGESEFVAEETDGAEGGDFEVESVDGDGSGDTPEPIEESIEGEPEESEPDLEYLGDWTITAYCGCSECCGAYGNATASGATPCSGHTVACNVLPMGTQVMIDDVIYTVEDTGWTPYGDAWIDIYFDTHEEALAYGLHTTSVYIVH